MKLNKKKFAKSMTIIIAPLIIIVMGIILLSNKKETVPTISLIGEENIQLSLNDEYKEQGARAFIKKEDISDNIIIDGNVDTTKPGEYKLKYTIFNTKHENPVSVERTIQIEDNTKPTITLKGSKEVEVSINAKYKDEGCVAEDNYDGDITKDVIITGEVDTKKEGAYTITYTVKDSSGNTTEETRTVNVKKGKEKSVETSSTATKKVSKSKRGLPVLMYHFFYDKSKNEKGTDNNFMEISAFEEQMKYLADNNYYFPSWSEVEAFVNGEKTLPEKSVVITIDDGADSFVKEAIPIINKYNVKATSFVVTSWNGDWLPTSYKSSHLDFQSHSHDMHRAGANGKGRIVNLSYKEALEDVQKSKQILGNECKVFCYPFGHYNDTAKKVLKDAGFSMAFTTEGGRVYPGQDKFALPRVRMSKGVSLSSFKSAVQ